jgi:polyketide biosynthesis 3-hydroxy-3-methylglutaryl-CoA synthase-like enzyme PksG
MEEYELANDLSLDRMSGMQEKTFDVTPYKRTYEACLEGRGLLVLDRIANYHRKYRWS